MSDLLPEYCDDPSRGFASAGFKADWSKVNASDARDFLLALDTNLIRHVGRGQYLASRSAAKEQFFWEGQKSITPRPISLWLEPIITVTGFARLHFEYGWPGECPGTQSPGYAFDLMSYNQPDSANEHVACEVKKSISELDRLAKPIRQMAAENVQHDASMSQAEINAFRKSKALRDRKPPMFWALGPGRANYAFQAFYGNGSLVTLRPSSERDLYYREFQRQG